MGFARSDTQSVLGPAGNPGRSQGRVLRRGLQSGLSAAQAQRPNLAPLRADAGSPSSSNSPRLGRFLLPRLLPLPPAQAKPRRLPRALPPLQAPRRPAPPPPNSRDAERPPRAHLSGRRARGGASPTGGGAAAAGTRLPIPYMDKCAPAKSGIQAPDVSLQLSGHRTGDRGEGVGTVGRKEGERHQPAAAPALPKFHFLSVGSLPGPARAFPG